MPENPKSPRDQFVDDVLDATLRNYSRSEPLAGLENRVLRRLQQNPPKASWLTGWHWTAVGAVGTLAVVALALITYPPELKYVAPGVPNVAPGVPARRGAAEQRSVPAQIPTAPPASREKRMNKTIQNSGTRPRDIFQPKPLGLPPCKAGEVPAGEVPSMKAEDEAKQKPKSPPDCVPVSQQHPSQTRPPRH